jgi:hypothetical protein
MINDELHNVHSSLNIMIEMRCMKHVACMGELTNTYKISVRKYEGLS